MRRRKPSLALNIFAVTVASIALFSGVWIVAPAPTALIWIFAVVATECSLGIGVLGVLAVVLGAAAFRRCPGRAGAFAVIAGVTSILLAQLPLLEALPVAQHFNVTLSLLQYLNIAPADGLDAAVSVYTETYAVTGGQRLRFDEYRWNLTLPAAPRPAIVVVHGGSWRGGARSDVARWDRYLAAHGYAVFDIDYRLAPQPNYPAAADDVASAVAHIRLRSGALGVDPKRIVLLGRSAGGHLALLAAYARIQPPVQAAVSLYGPTDLTWGYNHVADPDVIHGDEVLRAFLGGTPTEVPDIYRDASPITYADRPQPPTLLIHGGRDRIVGPQHATRLAARLATAGNVVEFVPIPYALHGFDHDFDGWGSQIVRPELMRFLRDNLR